VPIGSAKEGHCLTTDTSISVYLYIIEVQLYRDSRKAYVVSTSDLDQFSSESESQTQP
jgi:hypothetical protein